MLNQFALNLGGGSGSSGGPNGASALSYIPNPDLPFQPQTVQAAIDNLTYIQSEMHLQDDFVCGQTQANYGLGQLNWRNAGNAGGGLIGMITAASMTPVSGRFGILVPTTGTTSNNTGSGLIDLMEAQTYCGNFATMIMQWAVQFPAALGVSGSVDYNIEMGFGCVTTNSSYIQCTNGAVIQYNRAASTNWSAYTSQNTTQTLVTNAGTSFVISTSTWYNFAIGMGTSAVNFYVGAPGSTAFALLGTSQTNLPNGASFKVCPFINIYKNTTSAATATGTTMAIDWVTFDYSFAGLR